MHCPSCGAHTESGSSSCQALWEQLLAADFSDFRRGRHHRRAVDSYALQHPEKFCKSAKSFAAHLTGLCCAMEHNENPSVHAAVQRWLNGRVDIEKPALPANRGSLTIAHVHAAEDHDDYVKRLVEWSEQVWTAYADYHALARAWLAAALGRTASG